MTRYYDDYAHKSDTTLLTDLQTAINLITRILGFLSHGLRQCASAQSIQDLNLKLEALENRFDSFESGSPHDLTTYKAIMQDKIEEIDARISLQAEAIYGLAQKDQQISDRITRNTEEIWRYLQESSK